MRARTLRRSLLALAVLAIVPLATHGGQTECCNASTSLASPASIVAGPVNGDEAFFKLPTGPANVMLLLDSSGSMINLPPCGDPGWNGGVAACTSPTVPAPSNPSSGGTGTPKIYYTVNGSCAPSTLTAPAGTSSPLYWMEQVTPQTTLADPGRSNSLVTDKPPWGNGCVGNACLFDPNAYFFYGDWQASASGASSTRRASDTDATLPGGCIYLNSAGTAITDYGGNQINLGSACQTCMTNHGFYFFSVKYYDSKKKLQSDTGLLFKGTFLNAMPPKFVSAKKVIKDVAFLDPANPGKMDQVRLGLTILDASDTAPQKADLIVPLGPDKVSAFPPTQAGFAQARQYILSVLNYDKTVYKDSAGNVTCDGTTITGGFFNPANTSTPLGSALFNIGQYFGSLNLYNTLLGTGFQTTAFNESSSGLTNAAWARGNPNQCSICWACQNNAIVVVTDGSPNSEIPFPSTISNFDTPKYTAAANCGTSGTLCGGAIVPRVADWIHSIDLRTDAVMSGKQALTIHTVGIDINKTTNPTAAAVLQATANLGGGLFQSAEDPTSLANAVVNAINQVIPKENSFSAASATSLQTVQTASAQAFLTRFKPNQTPTWEGHVFETFLFDEALNGCDPSLAIQPQVMCQGKLVSADFNGDGKCDGLFMIDSQCDPIAEDPTTGDFVKSGQGSTPAVLAWDAGHVLSFPTDVGYTSADETAANARNIFTYVNGAKVQFTAANATTLLPLMNITSSWCTAFLTQIGISGGTNPALVCAQQVIYFVRGWDVLDQDSDGCAGPGNPKNTSACKSGTKGEERDRPNDGPVGCTYGTNCTATPIFWKLGDIFHSSPAVLQSPIDEIRCSLGFDNQCLPTLFSPTVLPTQTPTETYKDSSNNNIDAYARYRLDNISRKRVVLVGSNDGMLHAFDAGDPILGTPDITGSFPYSNGTGTELWAFVPPDLLPRLKDLVSQHQYMVDNSIMLRDIWVDGSGSEEGTPDQTKQRDEYHTVAIFGRRSGGTSYSALDVTNPLSPTLIWTFPPPCSEDARLIGQTWSDFAPRPPPIGPVRMASTTDPRGFVERWIVMINGGYDPMLNLGRVVWMLDAWTGQVVWRFTDGDFKNETSTYGGRASMLPVPAAVGLTDIGDPTRSTLLNADGFFDTGTWGDLGGNLWVARFFDPGQIDPNTGRVSNWFAARAFEQQRQTDDSMHAPGRNEFFFMTMNAWDGASQTLRTLLGSGNREQMMNQSSTCGTDNLLGCCQAGCSSVTSSSTYNYGACNATTTFSCVNGVMSYSTSTSSSCGTGTATCAASPGNAYSSADTVSWTCPGSGTIPSASGTLSIDSTGTVTTSKPINQQNVAGSFSPPSHNRFYGVWAYGRDPNKLFHDAASALAFDKNRFTDVSYPSSCTGPMLNSCTLVPTAGAQVSAASSTSFILSTTCLGGLTKCSATPNDPGWYYEYGDFCPLSSCIQAPPWTDEKTGSGATAPVGRCAGWGSFRPVGASTSTNPCSGSLGVPVTYAYGVDYMTGAPSPIMCGSTTFATQRAITSPPNTAIPIVDVIGTGGSGSGGGGGGGSGSGSGSTSDDCSGVKVVYGSAHFDPGSPVSKSTVATRSCTNEPIYWLEVPRDLHTCRHVAGSGACE